MTTSPPPAPVCAKCGSPTMLLSTIRLRGSLASIFRCIVCGHRQGQLHLDEGDPPDVHRYVRRKLKKELAKTINTTPESAA